MGFLFSKLENPIPTQEEWEPTDESDPFEINLEDISNDRVQIEDAPSNYYPNPPTDKTLQQRGANASFFDDWISSNVHDSRDMEVLTETDIERRAKQAPAELNESYMELLQYLTEGLENTQRPQTLMARSVIAWLSHQDVDALAVRDVRDETRPQSPREFLSLLGKKRTSYSTFFAYLCRLININCAIVKGVCKAGSYKPGDKNIEDFLCSWTALELDKQWHIVHPFWICRSVVGRKEGGWIKLEAGGKFIGERSKASEGRLQNAFKTYYFLTEPAEFIYRCHPNDQRWQLLDNPVSREEFVELSHVFPPFFGLSAKLLSKNSCLLHSENGRAKIILKLDLETKKANEIDLWYELFLRDQIDGADENLYYIHPDNIPKLVAMIRNVNIWEFQMQFPIEGTYKLRLYGSPHNKQLRRLAEFRIDCSERVETCNLLPIDPGIIGFGPGPAAEAAGLYLPTRKNGAYKVQKAFIVKFTVDDKIHLQRVKSAVRRNVINETGIVENVELTNAVKMRLNQHRQLEIEAKFSDEGDHVLSIATSPSEISEYENVCNYLLHVDKNAQEITEPAPQRFARRKLLGILDEDGKDSREGYRTRIEKIQTAINKCLEEKIPSFDEDVETAVLAIECIKAEESVQYAEIIRSPSVIRQKIKELQQSKFNYMLNDRIRELEQLYQDIDQREQE